MSKIALLTHPNDYHSFAVHWALEQLGADVFIWMPTDLPDHGSVSIWIDEADGVDVRSNDCVGETDLSSCDVIWNRRRRRPVAPPSASQFDVMAIEMECWEHVNSALWALADDVIVVNHPTAQSAADRKALQLKVAAQLKFNIVPTLITNNYNDIISFSNHNKDLIVKSYKPHLWTTEDGWFTQMTALLPPIDDSIRRSIELCPIIVQKKIIAASEARVFVFGNNIMAASIKRGHFSASIDARIDMQDSRTFFEVAEVPSDVAEKCLNYLQKLKLHMGAFDFIIDDMGTWTFLECNEAGQFLFLEQRLPTLKILDRFSRWLMDLSGSASSKSVSVSLSDFETHPESERIVKQHNRHKRIEKNDFSAAEMSKA